MFLWSFPFFLEVAAAIKDDDAGRLDCVRRTFGPTGYGGHETA